MRAVLRRMFDRQRYVLLYSDTSFTEQMMACCYIGWGLIISWLLPDLFRNNPAYKAMGLLGTQAFWGASFLLTGALKLAGSSLDGVWSSPAVPVLRALGALCGTLLWTFVVTMFIRSVGPSTAVAVYLVFAMSCVLTLSRYVRELGRLIGRRAGRERVDAE